MGPSVCGEGSLRTSLGSRRRSALPMCRSPRAPPHFLFTGLPAPAPAASVYGPALHGAQVGPCSEAGSAFQVGRATGSPWLLLHPPQCEVSVQEGGTGQGEGMTGIREALSPGWAWPQNNGNGVSCGPSSPSVTTEKPALSNPKVLVLLPGVRATGSCWCRELGLLSFARKCLLLPPAGAIKLLYPFKRF